MVYVVERYLPGLCRADLLPGLSRLEPAIDELRREGSMVRYLGSTIVLGDEACFCQFDGPSEAAVAETNHRAGLPFDRIVPALLVDSHQRRVEMSVATSIPKTARLRRSHPLAAITAIVAVIALATWAIATYAVQSGTRPARSSAPSQASVLRSLTSQDRHYVLGILSLTPAQVRAAFGTSVTSLARAGSGAATHPGRSGAPTLASVLRSLTPMERRYVLGILSLTPAQFRAAFGTSTRASTAATSASVALPILPACGPGACWRAGTSLGRPTRHGR
jgi:hypothetical protein